MVKDLKELTLEQRIARIEAYKDVQNIMGKYMVRHVDGPPLATSPEVFALKTPGVLVEIADWGLFRGAEKVKRLYEVGHGDTKNVRPGIMYEHDLCTPIIEVARDCKTAKATWQSPGFATKMVQGKLTAQWRWLKIAAAFVVEDGQWKLWKYNIISTFFADFYKSWVDYQPPGRGLLKDPVPEPVVYDNPYSPTRIREAIPAAPEPYDTWDKPIDWVPI